MSIVPEEAQKLQVAKVKCLKSLLFHTRYFFKKQFNRKFIINNHHELICEALEKVLRGETRRLIINIAPRYGKTELAVKSMISNGLALNPSARFIHISYSDSLALDNSESIKDLVQSAEYQQLFPDVKIKADSNAKDKWYTTQNGGVLARAAGSSITGFGAGHVDSLDDSDFDDFIIDDDTEKSQDNLEEKFRFNGAIIIDDPLKPLDADSEAHRERVNERYDNTIKNRVNSRKTPIIIIMQRLHERDLCGYLMQNEPDDWTVLSLPCISIDESGKEVALWPFKHTLEELRKLEAENPTVFQRQYGQNPMPAGGYLYKRPWKTYTNIDNIPYSKSRIRKSYTDTADLGTDFLCSIAYTETELGMYVTDVIYTQEGMETTEPMTARQIYENRTELARVESNNGGRGFARNVESQTRLAGNKDTVIEWFHQSANKYSRIFNNSNSVQNLVVFPEDWQKRWPKFAKHVNSYMAVGKNAHDDAPDALTGMAEYFGLDSVQPQDLAGLF